MRTRKDNDKQKETEKEKKTNRLTGENRNKKRVLERLGELSERYEDSWVSFGLSGGALGRPDERFERSRDSLGVPGKTFRSSGAVFFFSFAPLGAESRPGDPPFQEWMVLPM